MVSLSGRTGMKNSLDPLGSLCPAKSFRDKEFLWFGQPTVEMRRKGEEEGVCPVSTQGVNKPSVLWIIADYWLDK